MTTAAQLRTAFDDAGYTLDNVVGRLGPHAFAHLSGGELAPLAYATRGLDRLDVLVRLFLVGIPVPYPLAAPALSPLAVEGWSALAPGRRSTATRCAGASSCGRSATRATTSSSTTARDHRASLAADHVLGVSASTTAARRGDDPTTDRCRLRPRHRLRGASRARRRPQRPGRRVGRQPACDRAGDADDAAQRPRPTCTSATAIASNPFAGERFDLIVANPPFVISPSRRYLFRDSGLPLDEMCRSIVARRRRPPQRRRPLPVARLVGPRRRRGLARTARRVVRRHRLRRHRARARGARRRRLTSPRWLRQTEPPTSGATTSIAWMEYCDQHRVEAVGFGLITMRRRAVARRGSGPRRRRRISPCRAAITSARCSSSPTSSTRCDDATLLDQRLAVAPDVVLDERLQPTADGWAVGDRRLRQTGGTSQRR